MVPAVTVVIPVWDEYVRFLPATLDSLERQRPRPAILVVDNASRVPVADERCEVIRSPSRLSRGAARNLGLHAVKTELVIFWDADDRLHDGVLGEMIDALEEDVRAVGCPMLERGSRRAHRWPPRSTGRLCRHARAFALLELVWHRFPVTRSLVHTSEAREVGGYRDADQSEDWPPAAALAARGRVRLLDRPGIDYRVHPGAPPARAELLGAAAEARRAVRSDPAADPLVRLLSPLTGVGSLLIAYVLLPLRALLSNR